MWTDLERRERNSGESTNKKVEYVKLTPGGTVKLRILDEQPESRWVHWVQSANKGKGLGIRCNGKGCPICADISEKKKTKQAQRYSCTKSHSINVLNRNTGKVEILDKGNKIFEQLLNMLNQMGDLRNFDISITTTKTGSENTNVNYSVLPTFPPTPLTEAEKAMEKYDLKEITKGFTNEQILLLIGGATIEEVTSNVTTDISNDSSEPIDFTQSN
jgi:hypothetical protein